VEYKIIKRWLKGYTLYFNGEFVANDSKLEPLRQSAREHLAAHTLPLAERRAQ
jgi:hypothetical protein